MYNDLKGGQMDHRLIQAILTTMLIGFMIGLQRSLASTLQNKKSFIGSRTFALIALAGFMAAWLESKRPGFLIALFIAIGILIALEYVVKVRYLKRLGLTTEIAALLTFGLGVMVWYGLERYAIFIAVLTILLLELKPKLQQIERHISPTDIQSVVLLLVMSFVILPILPDKMVGPYHLFNPYKTWVMAIIIAALSFVGYVAIRIFGHRHGILITGAAGGLISSTAVTITLSKLFSKERSLLPIYTAGIAIAWTFMFLRVFVETLIVAPSLAKIVALPYLLTAIAGGAYVYRLYLQSHTTHIPFHNEQLEKNPLQLSEAIKFAILFGIIYGAVHLVEGRYGDIGVYLISVISGITDVDAITLSLGEMAKEKRLGQLTALIGIVAASYTNTLVKLGIAYWLGGRELGWSLAKFTILITITLFGGLWLVKYFG